MRSKRRLKFNYGEFQVFRGRDEEGRKNGKESMESWPLFEGMSKICLIKKIFAYNRRPRMGRKARRAGQIFADMNRILSDLDVMAVK